MILKINLLTGYKQFLEGLLNVIIMLIASICLIKKVHLFLIVSFFIKKWSPRGILF